MNYFLGYEDFVDIFGGSAQNWTSFRVISMHFRVFLRSKYRIWIFLLKFQIFFGGCLIFMIFSGVNGYDAWSKPMYEEKMRVPFPPPPPPPPRLPKCIYIAVERADNNHHEWYKKG